MSYKEESDDSKRDFARHISTIIATVLAGVFIFVAYLTLSVSTSNILLKWHVLLMTLSFVLLMPWTMMNITDLCILTRYLSWNGRKNMHALFGILTLSCAIASFGFIVAYKVENNSNHFQSDHAKIGLTAVIVSVVVAFGGVLLNFRLISPRVLKICHPLLGLCALALALAAECLGFQKGWFVNLSSTVARDTCISLSAIGGIWVALRPLINVFGRFSE